MESKIKHLEMIQGIISRLSNNSFSLKGWAVTLVSALFALSSNDTDKMYFLLAYIPILIFWGLDSYYLLQERMFRNLYDAVRNLPPEKIDFHMDAEKHLNCEETKHTFWGCFFSGTIFGFYAPLALLSTGIIIVTHLI